MEDKLFKLWNSIYSRYNLKTLKNYLKKAKVKENNLFDKADSCITLISTEKEKSQHTHLAVFALIFQVEKLILCQ